MERLSHSLRYLSYWLDALEEHSIHSPQIYDLYNKVICNDVNEEMYEQIEKIRDQYLGDQSLVTINDLGAGSRINPKSERTLADIAENSLSSPKLSRLLYRLINHLEVKSILELGTSLGINSLYLAKANKDVKLVTFEGCENTAAVAEKTFKTANVNNIRLMKGDISRTLSYILGNSDKPDFVFFDANHTKEATLRYFKMCLARVHEDTVFVIADIHWSDEMHEAWKKIKANPLVTLSIDLFEAGILFFHPDEVKNDFILEF